MDTNRELADLTHVVGNAYPEVSLDVHVDPVGDLVLDKIVVSTGQRGRGLGTTVMNLVTAYADANGIRMSLTPSADFGGTVSRLRTFYKRCGFVDNAGRNRDFSTRQAMLRDPIGQ